VSRARARVLAALALGAAAVSCADAPPKPTPPPSLCHIDTTVGLDRAPKDRVFPPSYWFVLLLSGYQSSGALARPARDCRGMPVRVEHDGCAPPAPAAELDANVTPADLHVARIADKQRLVWVEARHYADGQAEGPVALVDVEEGGLAARALGMLRAYHDNVALRLVTMDGGTVLVAESERCDILRTHGPGSEAPKACDRAIRLIPLLGDRFVDAPIVDDRGACLDSPTLQVRGSGAAPDGTRYQIESQVTFGPDAINVREELAVENRGRASPADASFVTRVQAERRLTLRGGRLSTREPGLLARWLAHRGAAAEH
jgi:hypothetical protein